MTTINDVAKLAGVSKSTVSHVFNRTKPTSKEIQEKVFKAAEKLNYKRNYFAKTLATNKSKVIGIRLDSEHEFFDAFQHQVVEGILQACVSRDYYLLVMPKRQCRNESFPVDGMIMMNPSTTDNYLLKLPHVWLGKPLDSLSSPYYVDSNNEQIIKEIINVLIKNQHKSILFLNSSRNKTVSHKRYQTFISELVSNGYSIEEAKARHYFAEGEKHPVSFAAKAFYIGYDKFKPDAVIVDNDYMAQGIYRASETMGLSIPHKLSVISISETLNSFDMFSPRLSSVKLNELELGRVTANLLMDLIEGKTIVSRTRFVKGKIDLKGSVRRVDD